MKRINFNCPQDRFDINVEKISLMTITIRAIVDSYEEPTDLIFYDSPIALVASPGTTQHFSSLVRYNPDQLNKNIHTLPSHIP